MLSAKEEATGWFTLRSASSCLDCAAKYSRNFNRREASLRGMFAL